MTSEGARRAAESGEGGFTLLEALISLAVFAVILIPLLTVYDTTQQSYVRGEARVDLQQNVRVAVDQIMRDVRLGGYDPSNAINAQTVQQPLQPVTGSALSGAELRVIADANGDGTTDCVGYRLSNGQILRRQASWGTGACTWTAAESAVADNITGLTIAYFPKTGGTATTDPTQAKRVRVQISATASTTGPTTTFTETSEAALRQ